MLVKLSAGNVGGAAGRLFGDAEPGVLLLDEGDDASLSTVLSGTRCRMHGGI